MSCGGKWREDYRKARLDAIESKVKKLDSSSSWYVYILKCADGSLYTGITVDVDRRLVQHNEGKGAKYTRSRGPVELLYTEQALCRSSATKREMAIKKMTKSKKQRLIESGVVN